MEQQVGELRALSATFKRYLETMLKSTDEEEAPEIIASEDARVRDERLRGLELVDTWTGRAGVSLDELRQTVENATSLEDLADRLELLHTEDSFSADTALDVWSARTDALDAWEEIRTVLGLDPLDFQSTDDASSGTVG